MAAPCEVLITTDSSGQLWNACVWDPHSGTSLLTYKGNSTGGKGLCVMGKDYLIGAVLNKPLLQVWPLQRKDQIQMKMVCPGKVSSLAVTSDGSYCVAGIEEKIHVWQVASGNLLAVLAHHYQKVTCLKFTDDDSLFVSGSEDNLVVVWSLHSVLCSTSESSVKQEPISVWRSHSLPVTDLFVGAGGKRARVISSSLDHTCKLWDLSSNLLLLNIIFDSAITSVSMDTAEYRLFAGSMTGKIFAVNLFTKPVRAERHVSTTEVDESVSIFEGHSKQVTCLSVSLDGSKLYTGSDDSKVKLWDILSGQCVKTIDQKGPVTNLLVLLAPLSMFSHNHKPSLPVQSFKRHLYEAGGDNSGGNPLLETIDMKICGQVKHSTQSNLNESDWRRALVQEKEMDDDDPGVRVAMMEEELVKLKQTNKDIYDYSRTVLLGLSEPS